MSFLGVVLKHYRWQDALWAELEEWVGFLVRSLPGVLGFVLRWLAYRPLFGGMVSMPILYPGSRFVFMRRIRFGRGVLVNADCYLYGRGGIEIGDHVLISPGCAIVAGNHDIDAGTGIMERPSLDQGIVIGRDVWIGANCVVVGGVTIAEGCVIGAGAVVTRDTEPYGVYVGAPARFLRKRGSAPVEASDV